MRTLEFLGLHPDGDKVTLNDADGNRYTLAITDELRAALRQDRHVVRPQVSPEPLSVRELQALFRSGKTLEEVSQLTNTPPSELMNFETPIRVERDYQARTALNFPVSHDDGGLTVEELVASRLAQRGVSATSITWDAVRESGQPWVLIATYTAGGTPTEARWTINSKAKVLTALNDEAMWLSEHRISATTSPWRAVNTPLAARDTKSVDDAAAEPEVHESPAAQPSPSTPSAASATSAPSPATNATEEDDDPQLSLLENLLDGLHQRRGQATPAPDIDELDDSFFGGAHPAPSEPEVKEDDGVLKLPHRSLSAVKEPESSPIATPAMPAESAPSASGASSTASSASGAKKKTTKKTSGRTSVPSWEDIVFGPKS